MKARTMLEGFGAALLLLFPYYLFFFHPQNHALYHHELPVRNLIGGVLIDLLCVSILATGLLVALPHILPPLRKLIEALFAGLMLWCIVALAIQVLLNMWFPIAHWASVWWQLAIAIPMLSGVLAYFFPRISEPAVGVVRLTVATFAFSGFWIVPQLLFIALARQPNQNVTPNLRFEPTNSGSNKRIVWILFDELSYAQTFEHPAPGIRLPNFNRLQTESFSFSNLTPAGYLTDHIIPSLFLGRRFNEFRSTITGELWYKDEPQQRWLPYDPNATLFGLAQRNGWNPGADGWYNPYCRILAPVLNACYWSPGVVFQMEEYGASEQKSMLANAAAAPNQLLAVLTHRTETEADLHIRSYQNIMKHIHGLIGDNRLRFVYLHLPLPHPPGIYDRQHHTLRASGNYLDNLVLADDTLGAILQEIDSSPLASQTTVIVSSDHSWRTRIYRSREDWSAEEERASGGGFDDRPVLLIRFPGQTSGVDVHAAIPELLEHDMIASMLRGQINNPKDFTAFLAQQSH